MPIYLDRKLRLTAVMPPDPTPPAPLPSPGPDSDPPPAPGEPLDPMPIEPGLPTYEDEPPVQPIDG